MPETLACRPADTSWNSALIMRRNWRLPGMFRGAIRKALSGLAPSDLVAPAAVAVLGVITLWACLFWGFSYDGSLINCDFFVICELYLVGAVIRSSFDIPQIGVSVQALCMIFSLTILAFFASAALAKGQVPYVDDTLAAIDRGLFGGFDWQATNSALAACPKVMVLLSYAYNSLGWQPILLLLAMGFRRSNAETTRFVASWSLGLLACVLPFHWLPARGAYLHYGIPDGAVPGLLVHLPWEYPVTLEQVRSGLNHTFGQQVFVGLVTVPSFHACAAVLLGWSFRTVPGLRWPLGLLNILMFVSAVPVGGHYLTDIVAGSVVAVGAMWLARRLEAMPFPVGARGDALPRDSAAIAPPCILPA